MNNNTMSTTLKLQHSAELRRISIDDRREFHYDDLVRTTRSLFPGLSNTTFEFKWVDDEHDKISVSCEEELKEAIRLMRATQKGYLKFEVMSPKQNSTQSSNEEILLNFIHRGVKCDECGVRPIVGIRYKCTVRNDYDLCERCEESKIQPYPMIKVYHPDTIPPHLNQFAPHRGGPCAGRIPCRGGRGGMGRGYPNGNDHRAVNHNRPCQGNEPEKTRNPFGETKKFELKGNESEKTRNPFGAMKTFELNENACETTAESKIFVDIHFGNHIQQTNENGDGQESSVSDKDELNNIEEKMILETLKASMTISSLSNIQDDCNECKDDTSNDHSAVEGISPDITSETYGERMENDNDMKCDLEIPVLSTTSSNHSFDMCEEVPNSSLKTGDIDSAVMSDANNITSTAEIQPLSSACSMSNTNTTPSALFVEHVTYPDGTVIDIQCSMSNGTGAYHIIKTWRVLNNGSSDWPAGCVIVSSGRGDNLMCPGNAPSVFVPTVKANSICDISLLLSLPMVSERYIANYHLVDPNGFVFLRNLWVDVTTNVQEKVEVVQLDNNSKSLPTFTPEQIQVDFPVFEDIPSHVPTPKSPEEVKWENEISIILSMGFDTNPLALIPLLEMHARIPASASATGEANGVGIQRVINALLLN
jgi:hypothetical protein